MEAAIRVSGAREHNLKDISVCIPHGKHTVIVGVSGSGKSTLAYDVIYAAGQKRLLDCLSEQMRRYTSQLKQPDVNYVEGLTPVISFKQSKPRKNPRATIGTQSEISTYLRYLYTTLGRARCPICSSTYPIRSLRYLQAELEKLPDGTLVELQFPVYKPANQQYDEFFAGLRKQGYKRIEIDGRRGDLRDWIEIEAHPHTMLVVADKIRIQKELGRSVGNSLKNALHQGEGFLRICIPDAAQREQCAWFFQKHGCSEHGFVAAEILPAFFSFNDPNSACRDCQGSGVRKVVHPAGLIRNPEKSLSQGPFHPQVLNHRQPYWYMLMYSLAVHYGFSFDTPFKDLPDFVRELIFHGSKKSFPLQRPPGYDKGTPGYTARVGEQVSFEGLVTRINRYYQDKQRVELTDAQEAFFNRFMTDETCPSCRGSRLKLHRQLITIKGYTFYALGELELTDLRGMLEGLEREKDTVISSVLTELKQRLDALINIGLGYLNLNRRIDTLSGGEYQRVRLAGQLGAGLMGLTYIIDEPTIGLHHRDTAKVIGLLEALRDQGNTVITIEHDLDVIRGADYIIEIGPRAGEGGGEVIAAGRYEEILNNPQSLIAPFLKEKTVHLTKLNSRPAGSCIKVIGASANNLKDIDVEIPLNCLVALSGVSGSGKSTLAVEVVYKAVRNQKDPKVIPGKHRRIEGMEQIMGVSCIDQSPINRSGASIPATYIGVFAAIRGLFAGTVDARQYGLDKESYFSFNAKGACPSCKGRGSLETHIHYLGDLRTTCPECRGGRFASEVLAVEYKGRNITQVLDMSIDAALIFFQGEVNICHKLQYVCNLGLGYMKLGQQIGTISGGEGQRLKLARELSKLRARKNLLYILDEPTTGLHVKDIKKLLGAMRRIVERGNTLLVVEHNPEVINAADYLIEMGPGAGKAGGEIVSPQAHSGG